MDTCACTDSKLTRISAHNVVDGRLHHLMLEGPLKVLDLFSMVEFHCEEVVQE
jgi:hypothetical protein